MEIYVVQPGDTVDLIAERTDTDVTSLIYTNQLEYPYRLAVGQNLLIAGGFAAGSPAETGAGAFHLPATPDRSARNPDRLHSSGYAYPFVSREVLEQTLPYLDELNIFSYGFTTDGNLIPPSIDENFMIDASLAAGVIPALTLTPLGADGRFNNNLVTTLANDSSVQLRLLRQLAAVMAVKGYLALNIDFEYILPEDRDAFTTFVAKATRILNQLEYAVSVALAPKHADDQAGLLYEGMDYGGLGAAANRVLLMTYEWGYTYGPPMAVAPLDQVRRVVEYALTKIPADKIILGVPNYGYDWPLPYERGITKAETLGNVEAVERAILHGSEIQFDAAAMSPYFHYWQYGVRHEVWFEDVRSYAAKFSLVKEYGLRGIGVWQLMHFFRSGWELWNGI